MSGLMLAGLPATSALFTADYPAGADISAGRIFRGERDTPAFSVTDVSSGSASDGSSAVAFSADGRFFTSALWPTAFDGARYLELDLNAPLPGGLVVSNAQVAVRLSGNSPTTTACYYVELRSATSGSVLSSHGSSGSPLGCVAGTTFATATSSSGALDSTAKANDLRVRIYGRDSEGGAIRIDSVVVTGDTPYSAFTLYPVLTRDAHDGLVDLIRWGLAGS